MESQPQNPEFRNNPENFHPCGLDGLGLICLQTPEYRFSCIVADLVLALCISYFMHMHLTTILNI